MTGPSIQDRTSEFSAILGQAQKRMGTSKVGSQRQALLTDAQRRQADPSPPGAQDAKAARSEFARRARDIGRGITGTMAKLQRLAECEYSRNIICRQLLTMGFSGETQNTLRRPPCRDLRIDLCDQARPGSVEPEHRFLGIIYPIATSQSNPFQDGSRRRAQ